MEPRISKLTLATTLFWACASAYAAGCMNPGPTPGGGPDSSIGGGGGGGGAGGSTSTGTGGRGGTSDAAPDGPQLNCSPTVLANANITNFSDWTPDSWGTPPGLTGTSFAYPLSAPLIPMLVPVDALDAAGNTETASDTGETGSSDEGGDADAGSDDAGNDTDASVVDTDANDTDASGEAGAADAANDTIAVTDANAVPLTTHLQLTGTIAAGHVAGFGLDFNPVCTDASRYRGISFTMVGTTGKAQPVMLVKTDDDVPMSGGKGHCPRTIGAGCVLPSKTFALPDVRAPIILSLSGFLGGQPTMGVDNRTLLGVQWQFECPPLDGSPDCVVNVSLDDVQFVESVPQE